MPCRHSDRGDSPQEKGLDRREFLKSALAIGGATALVTSERLYGIAEAAETNPATIEARQNRQHAWADFSESNEEGLTSPRYHLLLLLDYRKSGRPAPEDRAAVEGTLARLESEFEWSDDGLLFTVGYSRSYFERFEESLPTGIDLRPASEVIEALRVGDENPTPEAFEVVMHLSSTEVINLLTAEEALWGFPGQDRDSINGARLEHTFEGVFEKPVTYPARRTGYVGTGLPSEKVGEEVDEDLGDRIHDDAPLSMGFESVNEDSIPDERAVTLLHDQTLGGDFEGPGAFAQGTVEHVSKLDLDLGAWYERTKAERVRRMFSPHHTESDVGEVGENLGGTSGPDATPMRDYRTDDDIARRTYRDAKNRGLVGHAQKLARARFDVDLRETDAERNSSRRLNPTILRRDFDTTDEDGPGLHFVALMRFNGYMVYTRLAMNGVGFDPDEVIPSEAGEIEGSRVGHDDVDLPVENDGFLDFITTRRRGNFLVPPLTLRALPPARAIRPNIDVDITRLDATGDDLIPVVVRRTESFDPTTDLDVETVRFGPPDAVDTGGGAEPVDGGRPVNGDDIETADLLLRFRADEAGFDDDAAQSRLFGKTDEGLPVRSTAEMIVNFS